MYLTEEEYMVLSARKMGIHQRSEIAHMFKLSETTVAICDSNLFKKYGIKTSSTVEAKQRLAEVADLGKAEAVEKDKIPFFEYENNALVKKIKISKNDVFALYRYFQNISDENKIYELISDEDDTNTYRTLEIKDIKTGYKEGLNIKIANIDKNVLLIGVGGGGQNIVNYILKKSNDFRTLSINSDEQALSLSETRNILLCDKPENKFTNFIKTIFNKKLHLGCGGDVERAKLYTLACEKSIKREIKNIDEVIIISCFGGGIGTGATPLVAKCACALGAKVNAIIINPFNFEGSKRKQRAQEGIIELKKYTKNIYQVQNEDLIASSNKNESFINMFECANEKIYKMVIDILADEKEGKNEIK